MVAETGSTLRTSVSETGDWTFSRELSCPSGALRFGFSITNAGDRPLTMSWAGHALIPPSAVRDLLLPDCEAITQEFPLPAAGVDRSAANLWPHLASLPRGEAAMLVLRNCHAPEFTVSLDGLRWRIAIEGVSRPSLGLWYNNRGYPPEPGLEREEFGLEWMLTPECVLEQAAHSGTAITLAPQEGLRWAVIWSIEEKP